MVAGLAIRSLRAALLGGLALACSTVLGIDEDYRLSEGSAGAGGAGGAPPNAQCAEYANEVCEFREPCCSTLYPGLWNTGECIAENLVACEAAAKQTPAPLSYRPEMWSACKAALAEQPVCLGTFGEALDLWSNLAPCFKIITGPVPVGKPCKGQPECAFLPAPDKALFCENGICVLRGKLAVGDPCDGGLIACQPGTYCSQGKCADAVPVGGPCKDHIECGLGAACSPGGTCELGLPLEAPCVEAHQCASMSCLKGQCARLPTFSADACKGEPL